MSGPFFSILLNWSNKDPKNSSPKRRRSEERNPDIIIYTGDTYAILKNLDFLDLILTLKKTTQMKLSRIFKELTS
jgi:hypothetical protein